MPDQADRVIAALSNKLDTLGLGQLTAALNTIKLLGLNEGHKLLKLPEGDEQYSVQFVEGRGWVKIHVTAAAKILLKESDVVQDVDDFVTLEGEAADALRALPELV